MLSSLRVKFILVLCSFTLISCAVITVLAGINIVRTGEFFAEQQGTPVVEKSLTVIDGDEFERIAKEKNPQDPKAEEIRLALLDIKEAVGCQYLYTMAPSSGTTFEYIIDGSCDPSDEENFSPMGTAEDLESWGQAPFTTMKTGELTCSGFENQEGWGWKISSYKGIKNSAGKIVGFVGCDFDLEAIVANMKAEILKLSIASLFFLILGGAIVFFFSGSIFGTMKEISGAMENIAEGTADLTQKIPVKKHNEMGQLAENCNKVIQSLAGLVEKLQKESQVLSVTGIQLSKRMDGHILKINSATSSVQQIGQQISSQNDRIGFVTEGIHKFENEITNLDSRISAQTQAIEQSSSAIEEISANIQSVNKSVDLISSQYDLLVKQAKDGSRIQNEVSEQIEEIALQSQNLNEANAVITAIAEQTNLLAMNAAIEAAHAGELGKGFSVVADEIRTLAETSATQSAEIKTQLEGITLAIQEIVNSSKESSKAFDNVGSKISDMDNVMREIKSGMIEETSGVDNILETMKILDGTTRDINEASVTMKAESHKVFGEIDKLKLIAENTRQNSVDVERDMSEMKSAAEEAANASKTSCTAAENVVNMVNGFKVN